MRRRAVITGLGTVNPLGRDVRAFWKSLCEGESGIGPIDLFDVSSYKVRFGGQVRGFDARADLDTKTARHMDRYSQFAAVAAFDAVHDSGLDFSREDPYRCGVIVGSGIGGMNEYEEQHARLFTRGHERVSPFVIPKMMPNAASANISIHYGLRGPNTAVATACASAANAVADALRAIQYDFADVMVTGGAESTITPMALAGFINAQALSRRNDEPSRASRPFDKDRDGFVLSEGAGIVVLEEYERARKRGARIYAELLGAGATADAYNITAPQPEGAGAARAMQLCLKDGGVDPSQVEYVNAHGTSTPLGDEAETKAIKTVFGEHARRLAVSSTKSMLGHLLGASGGVELIVCALTIQTGVIHPTINYQTPDPACDLDYVPNTSREHRVRYAISNSFGFGGHNCCLLLGSV